ncbi:UDP-3-O-(3-hydroxymyristoyl)glucosamine N-acyltransferase [Gayadomonas joobiniege]|uniref:UDP-3-O-(3-hydroxymyristoyl)glucosamine N-acyltransferase n=1 Tax=Gayadomonas joobiniege TaxID=1234606 RepID=UPI000380D0DD|nr:UDP-3-O-(3-hydroxymyristoyl)glucosamine N-acyltransferase [Gayadomonas joobiniege]
MASFTLAQLAELTGSELKGNAAHSVCAVADLSGADHSQITFYKDKKYQAQLADSQAGAVILKAEDHELFNGNCLIHDNPYLIYAKVCQLFDTTPAIACGISANASIDKTAEVASDCHIGDFAVISAGAKIASGCQIGAGVFVGEGAKIGANTKVYANASIYHAVEIGADCIIHSNAVIGSDGFGYANEKSQWVKIPQVGRVIIGDRVEIGAGTTIDRGALNDTLIANGVIIDNKVHIAHNVSIGENSAIAANTGIAGSTTIGKRCTIAGNVGINGHINITDDVHFTGMTMVTQSIEKPGVYSSGMPATDNLSWRKNTARLRKVETLFNKVKALEAELAALKTRD